MKPRSGGAPGLRGAKYSEFGLAVVKVDDDFSEVP
jgi:hypothetical protein